MLIFFPQKTKDNINDKTEKIYLIYNEMHSDIVLNIQNLHHLHKLVIDKDRRGYISIGWGDKESYVNTPTWEDLKLSTTLKALFFNTPSVVHLKYYRNIKRFKNLKTIEVTATQIATLEKNILNRIWKNEQYEGYDKEDVFFSSKGDYNMFYTCNTWTGQQLRDINISLSYWTPLSYNVIHSLN